MKRAGFGELPVSGFKICIRNYPEPDFNELQIINSEDFIIVKTMCPFYGKFKVS